MGRISNEDVGGICPKPFFHITFLLDVLPISEDYLQQVIGASKVMNTGLLQGLILLGHCDHSVAHIPTILSGIATAHFITYSAFSVARLAVRLLYLIGYILLGSVSLLLYFFSCRKIRIIPELSVEAIVEQLVI